eukprot:5770463-Alexandrium_andersonii.AAC.1
MRGLRCQSDRLALHYYMCVSSILLLKMMQKVVAKKAVGGLIGSSPYMRYGAQPAEKATPEKEEEPEVE